MNSKQKVLLGLAGLTALAVGAGSVGTMAWFYSNTTVTASGLSMSVKSPGLDFKLSTDGTNYSTSLDFDFTAAMTPCLCVEEGSCLGPQIVTMSKATNNVYDPEPADGYIDNIAFFVPNSSNTINSGGSVSTGFREGVYSDYNGTGNWTSVGSADGSTYYYFHSPIYAKWVKETADGKALSYTITPTITGSADITKAITLMFANVLGDRLNIYLFNSESSRAVTFGEYCSSGATSVTDSFDFYAWLDGNSPYCTNANLAKAPTASVSISLSFTCAG